MKKAFLVTLIGIFIWSCATYQPTPPSFYLDSPPSSIVATLSLDERLQSEEGWRLIREGRGEKAKEIFSKLPPDNPMFHVGLGYAYYLLGQTQVAVEHFKISVENFPMMNVAHLGLAQIYLESGREEEAFSALREVLKTEPEHSWAKTKYDSLKPKLTQENLEEALDYLEENNIEKGKEFLLKALHFSPDSLEAHLKLAEIYKSENNFKNALLHLRSALNKEPEKSEILHPYGEILFETGEYKKSLEVFQKIAPMEPENQKVKNRIETLKNRLGIFELPSQYNKIPSLQAVTKEDVAALIAVKFQNILDIPEKSPPILIDIATSWASKFILATTSLGLLDVYPNHTFQPKKIVTRAEMAEILYRLIKRLESQGYNFVRLIPLERIQVSDVSPDNYYYQPILSVISYNIMSLRPDRIFNPDHPITGQKAINLFDIVLNLIQ